MTAEIAVLNFHGVAMAADSAVSIGSIKVYNSANKLFALSKKHPVGIMIYGNAQMMSVPWETLIKSYRVTLKNKKFKTLKEYGDNFIEYLRCTKNIGSENEALYLNQIVSKVVKNIRDNLELAVQEAFRVTPSLTNLEIQKIINDSIEISCKTLTSRNKLNQIESSWIIELIKIINSTVDSFIAASFENISLSTKEKKLILEACTSEICLNEFSPSHSGIVISGFGNDEIYPSLISYEIEWRINGFLKSRVSNQQNISVKNGASIVPFAQREMVDTFIEGADRRLIEFINSKISHIFDDISTNLFQGTTVRTGPKNLNQLKNNGLEISRKLAQEIRDVQNINFVNPVLDSVAALPLDELASMAHTLINMTSFKRRVSLNTESVGGPIDVAVISKGDGFIWINRKHYFKPELNQHYFVNNS